MESNNLPEALDTQKGTKRTSYTIIGGSDANSITKVETTNALGASPSRCLRSGIVASMDLALRLAILRFRP